MLGQFLECAIAVDDVGDALQFYRSLGYQDLPTADFITAPYAAVWDGAVTIGLTTGDAPFRLRFVRPDIEAHVPALRRQRVEIVESELGDEAFNRLLFSDNAGHEVELLEARTHSLAARENGPVAACGQFVEVSLPTHSLADSAQFWSALGFTLAEESDAGGMPRIRMTGAGCTIGFHQANFAPGIRFAARDLSARAGYLKARGLRLTPAPQFGSSALLLQPPASAAAIYLSEGDA